MRGHPLPTRYGIKVFSRHNCGATCTKTWVNNATTRKITDFIKADVFLVDWAFNILCAATSPAGRVPFITGVYRQHEGGVWAGTSAAVRLRNAVLTFRQVL